MSKQKIDPPPISPKQLGLKVLFAPENEEPRVDIVAVHGIGANPDYAWTTSGINWLEDRRMLPGAIPYARILRFGYDAIKQQLSTVAESLLHDLGSERKECQRRPIVFIGHCFDGLVIEKTLTTAKVLGHQWPHLFSSAAGIVFLGTPHRGTSLCCFFEQKPTKVGRIIGDDLLEEFVVDEISGCIDGSPRYSLPLDHFRLNKFISPNDGNYKAVREEIQRLVARAISKSIPSLEFAEDDSSSSHSDFSLIGEWAGAGSCPSTTVLLISYEEDDNCTLINRDRLRSFFVQGLGFEVKICRIPWDNAQLELERELEHFVSVNDRGKGHLIIIYYIERGSQPYAKQPILSVSSRLRNGHEIPYDKTKSGSKDWIIPRTLFDGVQSNILEIMDCWSAGNTLSQQVSPCLGRHEVLVFQQAPLPDYTISPLDTPTRYFCLVVESLLSSCPTGFTTHVLYHELNRNDRRFPEAVMPRQVELHASPSESRPTPIVPQRNMPLLNDFPKIGFKPGFHQRDYSKIGKSGKLGKGKLTGKWD